MLGFLFNMLTEIGISKKEFSSHWKNFIPTGKRIPPTTLTLVTGLLLLGMLLPKECPRNMEHKVPASLPDIGSPSR